MDLVQATQAFMVPVGGVPYSVAVGDVFAADDPIVKGRSALFGEITVRDSRAVRPRRAARPAGSETATAAPGERRERTTPTVTATDGGATTNAKAGKAGQRPVGEV